MEQSLESFSIWFRELYHLDKPDVREYSALTLAYIGDAVYEIIIRSYIVGKGNAPVERLHKRSSRLVKAETQANLIMAIEDQLTEEEHAVYRRGRNTKSVSPARNQSLTDYRRATGFEALIGWLYLKNDWKRIIDLVKIGLAHLEEKDVAKGE